MSEAGGYYSAREQGRGKGNGADSEPLAMSNSTRESMNTRPDDSKQSVSETVGELAGRGVEQTEKAMATVGEKMSSFGDDVRDTLPQSGTIGTAAGAVADGLKSSGEYLQTHGFEDISKDLTSIIRNNPVPAVWIGVGIGFLLGQALVRK